MYSFRPQRLSAWFAHYRQLHSPAEQLSAADREMIAVVVSAANGCLYCSSPTAPRCARSSATRCSGSGSHTTGAGRSLILAARAICAYAEKLTLRPREVTRADLRPLLDVGLTLEDAWDVAEIAAMYNLTNRMAMATNMLPNEQYSGQARP